MGPTGCGRALRLVRSSFTTFTPHLLIPLLPHTARRHSGSQGEWDVERGVDGGPSAPFTWERSRTQSGVRGNQAIYTLARAPRWRLTSSLRRSRMRAL